MPATRGQVAFCDGKTVVSLFKRGLLFLTEIKKFRLETIGWQLLPPADGTSKRNRNYRTERTLSRQCLVGEIVHDPSGRFCP